jgi:hypothetical protein
MAAASFDGGATWGSQQALPFNMCAPGGLRTTRRRSRPTSGSRARRAAATWPRRRETHVTGSFNFLAAPNAGGYFLGDYAGLAANGTSFVGVDDITNCNAASCGSNPTDTYAFGLP